MPDYTRRRKILVVALAFAGLLYFGNKLMPWHHHQPSVGVTIDAKDDGDTTVTKTAVGDGKTKVHLALPGGFKADVDVPERMTQGRNMDIDGVGMFPGASLGSVSVDAKEDGPKDAATVKMGFDAPAAPAAVADWYQKRFADKGRQVSRTGNTLTGKTEDGKDFTIALTPSAEGAHGEMTIIGQ